MAVNVKINTPIIAGGCDENDNGEEKVKMGCCVGNSNALDNLFTNRSGDEIFTISSKSTGLEDVKNDGLLAQKNLSLKNNFSHKHFALEATVLKVVLNENDYKYDSKMDNSNCNKDNTNCWFKFLSILCFWRMSSDELIEVQAARVQGSETRTTQKGSEFTAYKIVVHAGSSNWHVFRRYAEFHKLHELIKKQVPNAQLKLPGKKLFGNNLDPDFIAERQNGLDAFVQQILGQPSLLTVPEVRNFFMLENLKNSDDKKVPSEDKVVSSKGKEVSPEGEEASSEGKETSSEGKEVSPEGEEASSEGKEVSPEGEEASSEGKEVSPEGEEASSEGKEVSPEGEEASSENEEASSEDDSKTDNELDTGTRECAQTSLSDFKFLSVIGQGSFGKVYLTKHVQENKYYAIKVLSKSYIIKKNETKHIMTERNVLIQNINHPFLVGLHYSFQTAEKLYMVLDYVNGGELFFHLQKEGVFGETRSKFYASEMACALGYLHSRGVIYRDLKPENILLDPEGHIVLTDFGLSKDGLGNNNTTKTFCGTPEYLAPEVILKQDYDRAVDWWCLGVVLYEMLSGWPPFYSKDTSKMYDRIVNRPLLINSNLSEEARSVLKALLEKDKNKRLGSGQGDFQEVKAHPFFHGIDWDDLKAKRIEPPFNPRVRDELDLSHIDPEFVKEGLQTPIEEELSDRFLSSSLQDADELFAGFSYCPNLSKSSP